MEMEGLPPPLITTTNKTATTNENKKNKCVNCNIQLTSQNCRNLHQLFNFGQTMTSATTSKKRRKSTRLSSLSSKVATQLQLTIFEALDLVFQINDERTRELINTTDSVGLCVSCTNIFTSLFQLYLQFVSASASSPSQTTDSLIRNVLLQQTSAVQKYLQEYLVMIQKEQQQQQPIQDDQDKDIDDELLSIHESEVEIESLRVSSSIFDQNMKQELGEVPENIKVEVDVKGMIHLNTNKREEDESDEYCNTKTTRQQTARTILYHSKNTSTGQGPPSLDPKGKFKPSRHPAGCTDATRPKYKSPKKPKPIPKCTKCCESFVHLTTLLQHLKVHEDETSNILCTICNSTFNTRPNLKKHMFRAHPTAKIPGHVGKYGDYSCTKCTMKFLTKRNLHVHLISKHLHCPLCTSAFSTKHDINSHMESSHGQNSSRRMYYCNLCDFEATNHRRLLAHEISVHTGTEEVHTLKECKVCGKTFIENSALARHMSFHSDERPFKCDSCPMSFKCISNLRTHKSYIHDGVKFICEICGHASSSPANLRKHVRGVHYGISQTQKRTPVEVKKKRFRLAR